MSALSCGVDIGSTKVKMTLVDECDHALWTKAVPTPRLPDNGGVATDALLLVAMIEELIVTGWVSAWQIPATSSDRCRRGR